MPDHFATLDQPRRPWLDPHKLKQVFLNRSAQVHPDRVHNAAATEREAAHATYTDLNEAYHCLSDPRKRLAHLIELETRHPPSRVQSVPEGLLELFMQITPRLREADSLVARKAEARSPLLQVRLLEQSQDTIDQLHILRQRLEQDRVQLETELRDKFGGTETNGGPDWSRLEEIYRRFSYLDRWSSQIRERILQLSP